MSPPHVPIAIQQAFSRLYQQVQSIVGRVKADPTDTTPDFLFSKLVQGSNITLTLLNPLGNAQVRIDASGGGGAFPSTRIIWVSWEAAPGGDGSFGAPFQTIQAAVNAVPQATDSATARRVFVIMIAPGDYDEDVVIDGTRRRIALVGLGPWNLGQFNNSNWNASGTPRNITWNVNLGNIDSIRSALMIGGQFNFGEDFSTHVSYNTSPRISGKIIVNDNVLGGTTKELYVAAQVFDVGATGQSVDYAVGSGILNLYTWRSRFATGISGAAAKPFLQAASFCRFDGLVDIGRFSRINYCHIVAGLTVASAAVDVQPSGMTNTNFAGTFTGPVASAVMDGNTNYWFKTNAAVLAGGATKVIQDDLVP